MSTPWMSVICSTEMAFFPQPFDSSGTRRARIRPSARITFDRTVYVIYINSFGPRSDGDFSARRACTGYMTYAINVRVHVTPPSIGISPAQLPRENNIIRCICKYAKILCIWNVADTYSVKEKFKRKLSSAKPNI